MTKLSEYDEIGRPIQDSDQVDISRDDGGGTWATTRSAFSRIKTYVLSFTELMKGANNLSEVSNPATSRANIGAGTGDGDMLGSNNLSDLADDATARGNLGVDPAGTDNSTDVTLAGTPNYITIAGQVITRNLINLASHVSGFLPVGNISQSVGASPTTKFLRGDGAWEVPAGGGGPGSDTTAIHVDTADEIAGIALKGTPVGADLIVIEDSAAANAKKRITVGSLPTGGGGEANDGENVGVGDAEVFAGKSGINLQFKRVVGGSNITVSQDATTFTITGDVGPAPVDDFNGRTGSIIPLVGDYSAFYVQPGDAEHNNFSDYSANQHVPAAAVAIFDGAGSDIPNGTEIDVPSEWAGELTVGRLRSKQSGSITVTVSRCPAGSYPGGFVALDTIVLSGAQEANDVTVAGSILAGDTIRFATSGNTGVQHLMASVGMDKS